MNKENKKSRIKVKLFSKAKYGSGDKRMTFMLKQFQVNFCLAKLYTYNHKLIFGSVNISRDTNLAPLGGPHSGFMFVF